MEWGSGNRNKVFFLAFCDRVPLQPLDHFPEMIFFTKFVFDPDLEFFHVCFNHPPEFDLTIPKIQFYSNFHMVHSMSQRDLLPSSFLHHTLSGRFPSHIFLHRNNIFLFKKNLLDSIDHASLSIGWISYKVSTFSVSSNCAEFVLCLRSSITSTRTKDLPDGAREIE